MTGQSSGLSLLFVAGRFKGGELPLDTHHEVLVGRDENNALHLNEEGVSRVHAKFSVVNGSAELRDLSSTNGTFVNGTRITRTPLKDGDRVLIGRSIIMVVKDKGWAT
jgi:pSer/pThr/pTyr-binding forkhead associated (FHA) protein